MLTRHTPHFAQDFVEKITRTKELGGLTEIFQQSVGELGFSAFALHVVRIAGIPQKMVYGVTTYAEECVARYRDENYVAIDPIITNGFSWHMPFEWREAIAGTELSVKQRRFFGEAGEYGISFGYTIPIHGPNAQVSAITVTSDVPAHLADRLISANRFLVHLMGLYYNEHVGSILLSQIRGAEADETDMDMLALSGREKDCLSWVAQEKSSWEISRLIGVSERTVNFHVENAKRKLGVYSRQHAVVKAVMLKLILN